MRGRQGGFTLLEVVVALVIAGLALAALYEAAGVGLSASATSARELQALVRARSHLATAVHGGRLSAGTFQGDDGEGFHWLLRIAPVQATNVRPRLGAGGNARRTVVLYSVTAAVSWHEGVGGRRQVSLATEQVGAP